MTTTILLIDDNDEFRNSLAFYLKKELNPVEILEAPTGEEGVTAALVQAPDIVLMDLQLPFMDGVAASEKIKAIVPECYIIVLSLFAGDIRKQNKISDAIDDIVGKNEIEIKLLPLLHKYMRRKKMMIER